MDQSVVMNLQLIMLVDKKTKIILNKTGMEMNLQHVSLQVVVVIWNVLREFLHLEIMLKKVLQ
jgi:hypothetical protein